MGRNIDLNVPLSEEDKEFLYSRGRGHQVRVNERRFGVNGGEEADHEAAGEGPTNLQFDSELRQEATHDLGGGTILTPETGRTHVRDNGVYENGENPEPEATIDDDITQEVAGLTVPQLKEKLDELEAEYDSKDMKEDLQIILANTLQDIRDAEAEANAQD